MKQGTMQQNTKSNIDKTTKNDGAVNPHHHEHGDLIDEQRLKDTSQHLDDHLDNKGQGELNPQFKAMVEAVFGQVPLLNLLGVKVIIDDDDVRCELDNGPNKVGNTVQNILHGGVTATLLDTIGGVVAMLAVAKRMDFSSPEQVNANTQRLSRFATLDMRVDYLSPGRGKRFIATAEVVRAGSRSCTMRMLVVNETGKEIAIGTGSYLF